MGVPIERRAMAPQANERLLSDVFGRVTVVRPGGRETEHGQPVLLVRALEPGTVRLIAIGHRPGPVIPYGARRRRPIRTGDLLGLQAAGPSRPLRGHPLGPLVEEAARPGDEATGGGRAVVGAARHG